MKKRILSMLLAIVIVVTLMPIVAQAAAGFDVTTKVLSGGGRLPAQNNLQAGQTVTLQPIPDQGYGVYSIEAEDRYHSPIQLTDLGDGRYTFTMPSSYVSVKVEFAKPVGSVDFLSNGKFTLEMGKTLDLKEKIYFTPFVYLPTRLTWSSDNDSVATVDSDGNVTAVGAGVATITATAIDGTQTDGVSPSGSCKITVKKTSTITFDTDGGTTIAPITKAVGESFSVANPTKDGYTFAGWEPALPRYMPEENTTFTAQWRKNYTITQHPDTTNGTLYFQYLDNYSDKITSAVAGNEIAICDVPAEGYELTNLTAKTEAGEDVEVEFSNYWLRQYITMPSDNVIVSATFEKVDYDIVLTASAGGEAEVDKETAIFGDIVTVTAKPDTGYIVKSVTVTQDYSDLEPCSLEEEDEQTIDVTDNDDGTYSFTMPASDVAVNVEFELLAYDVWVGGVQITGANKDDITAAITAAGGNATGTATYDPDTNTLTLNNFSYSGAGALVKGQNYAAIGTTATELNIVLAGANSITCSGDDGNGIYATNNINISGSRADSLTISSGSNGIYTSGGKLSVKNTEVKIAAAGRNGFDVKGFTADNAVIDMADVGNIGIYSADVNISICNKTQVKISADYKAVYAYNSHITASGESSLVVEGALYRYNSNFVIENSTLTCDDLTISGAGDIAITDSQVTCAYLETDELTVTENSVLTCGDIVAWEDVTITASEVNAAGSITAQTLDADWNWIPTNIIITDASVTIAGDEYGITANTQIAGNSTVTVQGANAFNAKPTLNGTFTVYAGTADNHPLADANADETYASKYVRIVPAYTVTYMVGEDEVYTEKVEPGKDVVHVPEVPAKEGYTGKWDHDGKNITADTEINAVYTVKKYTVTYKADGKVVKTVEVEHGKDATAPEIPAKEGYNETAPKWDKDGKNITADTEINAVYTINKYTVTYKADGKVVKTVEVEHGKDATAPEIPAKEGYNETAPKWDKDGKNITADTTINAVYTKNQPGTFTSITPTTNAGGGKITDKVHELKEKIPFTQEEALQIEYGADVEVWLEVKDISASVPADDKKEIEKKLGDGDVAMYLDIVMFKQVGENEASRLTQLSDKVQITFELPDSYINTDKDVTRTYSIIHVHDGKAEVITPVFDAATKTLTFETDRFSTYGVVYTDEKITPPAEETVPPTQETTAPTEATKPASKVPETGDSFQPAFWIACMTLSIFCIAVLLLDAKRRHAR